MENCCPGCPSTRPRPCLECGPSTARHLGSQGPLRTPHHAPAPRACSLVPREPHSLSSTSCSKNRVPRSVSRALRAASNTSCPESHAPRVVPHASRATHTEFQARFVRACSTLCDYTLSVPRSHACASHALFMSPALRGLVCRCLATRTGQKLLSRAIFE